MSDLPLRRLRPSQDVIEGKVHDAGNQRLEVFLSGGQVGEEGFADQRTELAAPSRDREVGGGAGRIAAIPIGVIDGSAAIAARRRPSAPAARPWGRLLMARKLRVLPRDPAATVALRVVVSTR